MKKVKEKKATENIRQYSSELQSSAYILYVSY